MSAVWFALGVIVGILALLVIACAFAGGRDDDYEAWKNSEYRNGKGDDDEQG